MTPKWHGCANRVAQVFSKPMFAISISAPLSRMDDALYARSRELVTDFAARISHDIQAAEARV